MEELLESVQTKNLKGSFQKYLPAVLNEAGGRKQTSKTTLTERTGDKIVVEKVEKQSDDKGASVVHLKKLAGIN